MVDTVVYLLEPEPEVSSSHMTCDILRDVRIKKDACGEDGRAIKLAVVVDIG